MLNTFCSLGLHINQDEQTKRIVVIELISNCRIVFQLIHGEGYPISYTPILYRIHNAIWTIKIGRCVQNTELYFNDTIINRGYGTILTFLTLVQI